MWNVVGAESVAQRTGQVVDTAVIETLLAELSRSSRQSLPRSVFTGLNTRWNAGRGAVPGFTALETYADSAVEAYRGAGRLSRVGPAVHWQPAPRANAPRAMTGFARWVGATEFARWVGATGFARWAGASHPSLAWHDETVVVVSVLGPTRLVLDYTEEADDRHTRRQIAGPMTPLTRSYVDWRLYLGANTEVTEGEARLTRRGRGRWRAILNLPAAVAGVLIGKVVRRLGPIRTIYDRDDSQVARVEALESLHPLIAQHAPRLGADPKMTAHAIGVFVHGTRSCGVPALEELGGHVSIPIVRYEHDTFRPVVENARELHDLVRQTIECKHLVLIGHSRGGLVARLAAAYLHQSGDPSVIDVWTFGTPHKGTPIVGRALERGALGLRSLAVSRRLASSWQKLSLLHKLDVDTDDHGNPIEDPVTATFSILQRSGQLPPGIAIMAPGSPELAMIDHDMNSATKHAVGGACSHDDPRGGYSVFVRRLSSELFAGEPNDFIVGQDSSTGSSGAIHLTAPCGHSGYFRDPQVQYMFARMP